MKEGLKSYLFLLVIGLALAAAVAYSNRDMGYPITHLLSDGFFVAGVLLGGSGVISVLSNVAPEKTKAMADAALDGDFDTAAALQLRLLPLIRALFSEVNPIPVKAAMKELGFDCGNCRLPLTSMTEENFRKLQAVLPLR